ncbi:MAG: hypothetical protein KF863_08240 [Rubrivivax sp.]|nr:hypothetical protein [Rubrivivax sp.]
MKMTMIWRTGRGHRLALLCAATLLGGMLASAAPTAAAQGLGDLLDGKTARELQRAAREVERQRARESARERRERSREEARERRDAVRDERLADCERVAAWFAGTDHIPPEALARRFGGGPRGDRSSPSMQLPYEAWLLQDARFEPAFGQRYDAMSVDEGKALHEASRGGCTMPRNERGQSMSDGMLLFRAFDPRFQPQYVQAVRRIREAQAQVQQTLQALAALAAAGPGDEAGQALGRQAAQRAALEGYLDEPRRAAFRRAFAETYARVVVPAQEARVADAVAQARGLDGLQALARLQAELQAEARAAGAEAPAPAALRERREALVAEVAAGERARVDALGSGLVALERGVQWHADYRQRLEPLIGGSAAAHALVEHFEARRAAALQAAERELAERIAATRSEGELQALVARYLPVAADERHAVGTALFTRVAAQRDELHKRSVLGSASPPAAGGGGAARSTAPAARPVAAAAASGEPSESDLYDAFNAQLQARNAAARDTAERCNNRQFQNDPVLAMQCLQYGLGVGTTGGGQGVRAPEFRISSFQKLGCEKAQGETGWRCDYAAGIAGNVQLPPSMAVLMGAGNHGQARFVRRGDGWLMIPDPPR